MVTSPQPSKSAFHERRNSYRPFMARYSMPQLYLWNLLYHILALSLISTSCVWLLIKSDIVDPLNAHLKLVRVKYIYNQM